MGNDFEHNQPRLLQTGDIIRIGDANFTYEGATQIPPTVYVGQDDNPPYAPTVAVPPGYAPTIAAPPPAFTEYGASQNQQQGYQAPPPPPAYGGQSAYGQPAGIPPLPGYTPVSQPKKSRRGLWITLGIVGGILLVSCVICSDHRYCKSANTS